ncbi:hypothetical protein Pcinc_043216 [Petrolisthes cinctipes]|uniref:PBZ-type domain-containing protein n=1 Tax=Petrolisthes cinctipes TaxID=88211 RepID=A0AAE1BG08_PETCI|nr:hypothetical protein Pcinc_043216 [Petrolisthes cinctipes]
MESDEELARRLQAQFDEEAKAVETQEQQDAVMAQGMASQSHQLSDSEEEDDSVQVVASKGSHTIGRELQKTGLTSEQSHNTGGDRRRSKVTSEDSHATKKRGREVHRSNSDKKLKTDSSDAVQREHVLSDNDDDDREERKERPQDNQRAEQLSKPIEAHTTESHQGKREATGKKFDDENGVRSAGASKRPICKFGSSCYRKNPWHLQEFYHPHLEDCGPTTSSGSLRKSSSEPPLKPRSESLLKSTSEPPLKRSRESPSEKTSSKGISAKDRFPVRLQASAPFNFFLNKTYSVEETQNDPLSLVLPDILSPHMGDIVESAQLNFMVDLEFLMSNYKAVGLAGRPLLVMYGQLGGNPSDYPGLTCTKVNIPFQYGTHHTKMMLLQYKDGLRVVVHTANLVPDDWYEKTQGYWVSPLFPELENDKSSVLDGESPTRFKRDLVEYLQAYKAPDLTRWSHLIKRYDFTSCNVALVCSVPGYHAGENKDRWGHMKVRRLLHNHTPTWQSSRPVIAQCSSIGSLGKDESSWLRGELGLSLTGAPGSSFSSPPVNVIYPSEDDVFNSSQGWMGGSCLPYNSNTHGKQTWLTKHFHLWRSEKRGRTRAMPHIKTYTRVSKTYSEVQFLLLTSANLSKAAWGALQKQNSQLFIRSYEVGVLFLPKFVTENTEFKLGSGDKAGTLAMHYDLPLTPYPVTATPWFMNTTKKRKDAFGQTYLE